MRRLGGLVAALSLGCEPIYGLGAEPEELFSVEVRVRPATVLLPGSGLRLGVLWAGVPVYVPYCQAHGPSPLEPERELGAVATAGCRDPLAVVPGRSGPSVPYTGSGEVHTLRFDRLPSADLLVGSPGSRILYGSVVLFHDVDGDGQVDPGRCGRDDEPEFLFAASFHHLRHTGVRIAYVEGTFPADSNWYPHPGCAALPGSGFSLWQVGGSADEGCAVLPRETVLELDLQAPATFRSLACAQRDRESFPQSPARRPRDEALLHCTPDGGLAYAYPCACPEVRVMTLRGCRDELVCETADWDVRATPPDWWPCPITPG